MGRRVGTKRSDRRWEDDDGNVWASKLECEVYTALRGEAGIRVLERCGGGEGHSFDYTSPVRKAVCHSCASRDVVQQRVYTPDLYVVPASAGSDARGYYIEVKGHLRADRRNLLRSVVKAYPDLDLRFVFAPGAAHRSATSRLNLGEYVTKYLKAEWHEWDGCLPRSWL